MAVVAAAAAAVSRTTLRTISTRAVRRAAVAAATRAAAAAANSTTTFRSSHRAGPMARYTRAMFSRALGVMLVALAAPALGADEKPIAGLDHIPTAVRDLGAASARYRALGFALKPGRLHDNSILNNHAKFPDGTEIELITAT